MAFAGAFGRGVSVRSSQPEEALDKLLDSLGFGQPLWSYVLICVQRSGQLPLAVHFPFDFQIGLEYALLRRRFVWSDLLMNSILMPPLAIKLIPIWMYTLMPRLLTWPAMRGKQRKPCPCTVAEWHFTAFCQCPLDTAFAAYTFNANLLAHFH